MDENIVCVGLFGSHEASAGAGEMERLEKGERLDSLEFWEENHVRFLTGFVVHLIEPGDCSSRRRIGITTLHHLRCSDAANRLGSTRYWEDRFECATRHSKVKIVT